MEEIFASFSNREIALITWLSAIAVFILAWDKGIRVSMGKALLALMNWKILLMIFMAVAYTTFLVFILYKFGLWHLELLKDTVFWFFGTAFILMMNSGKIKDIAYFKTTFKSVFKLAIIGEFLSHIYTFSLLTEFLLMPFLIMGVLLLAFAESTQKDELVTRYLKNIFSFFGTLLFLFLLYKVFLNWNTLFTLNNFKEIIFVPALTILYLPMLYLLVLSMRYEWLFILANRMQKEKREKKRIKIILLKSANVNLNRIEYISINLLRLEKYNAHEIGRCLSLLFKRKVISKTI